MARPSASSESPVQEYRHDATRKNNPPAGLAAQGRVAEAGRLSYRYDPHLPPVLRADPDAEADRLPPLLQKAVDEGLTPDEAATLANALQQRQPWLEWAEKRQQRSLDVDPVALHVHERVAAQAILRTLEREDVQRDLFADPQLPIHEAVKFYEHDVDWTNRLILGDSLQVMASLARRESLAGQVQMIYLDPPYGINYKSNFQPKVGDRNVGTTYSDLTREPEMVKAYRDTWRLGIHSYLAYLRDRFILCRKLLKDSGSIFVQISDKNVHLVRNLLDEVFGRENFVVSICFKKKSYQAAGALAPVNDYILCAAKKKGEMKYNPLYEVRPFEGDVGKYNRIKSPSGEVRSSISLTEAEINALLEKGWRLMRNDCNITSQDPPSEPQPFNFRGITYEPPSSRHWSQQYPDRMRRLAKAGRVRGTANRLYAIKYWNDSPITPISNIWEKMKGAADPLYVVQTTTSAVQRCVLMASDPGDLVLDPTCGSGTTAYVAEKYGRRWITIDTSRVAISLARQRLLTSIYPHFKIQKDDSHDPGQGFVYKTAPNVTLGAIAQNVRLDAIFEKYDPTLDAKLDALNAALEATVDDELRKALAAKLRRKQKREGKRAVTDADERRWQLPEEGAAWAHWEVPFDADEDYPDALKAALRDYRAVWRAKMDEVDAAVAEGSEQEVLYDQPHVEKGVVRFSGPFTVEAVMPAEESLGVESPIGGAPTHLEPFGDGAAGDGVSSDAQNADAYLDTITKWLKADGVRFPDNKVQPFETLERTANEYLHAEGTWTDDAGHTQRVGVSFGPEHGAVTAKQVESALRMAYRQGYDALVFAGFSFDGAAQAAIDDDPNPQVRCHMAHIRPDVHMGDLLYRPSNDQLFTVFGRPRTALHELDDGTVQIEMEGVDVYVYDPVKNTLRPTKASKVAAWFVDADYDGRTFCISQAFFPDKSTWKKLQRALRGRIEEDEFKRLTGTTSLPFHPGEHERAAVKVIDPRGNEVMRVHDLGGVTYPQAEA
jgi:adenine-specific DNA-methyltransferase